MRAVVDTSVIVNAWRQSGATIDLITQAVLPLAVHAELLLGQQAARDAERERERREVTYRLLRVEIIRPDQETAERWAKLKDHLRRRGRALPHNDLWVAAAALQLDLPLVSLDRHHQDLPGVVVLPERE